MKRYTVKQLACLAGVSVRTLHHYDQKGLLKPSFRTEANYRLYTEIELYRLQQILFYRELGMPLKEIGGLLDSPRFELIPTLRKHRKELLKRSRNLEALVKTIDKTILRMKGEQSMLKDEELYEGFTKEKQEQYEKEAKDLYGTETVENVNKRIRKMSKEAWQALQKEGDDIFKEMSVLMDRDPGSQEVQALVARHHVWIEKFFPANRTVYSGLANGYATHPDFRKYYDKFASGFADFLKSAMNIYGDLNLKTKKP
jgi:DNA-binding transcriptional MerR regulator